MDVAKLVVTVDELLLLIKAMNIYKNVNPFAGSDINNLLSELTDLKDQLDLIRGAE